MNLQVFLDGYGRPKSVFIGLKKFLNISLKTFPISVQLWFRKSRMRARILYFFNKQSMLHSLRTKFLRTIPLRIHNLKLRIMSLTMIHLMKKSQEKNIHLGQFLPSPPFLPLPFIFHYFLCQSKQLLQKFKIQQ